MDSTSSATPSLSPSSISPVLKCWRTPMDQPFYTVYPHSLGDRQQSLGLNTSVWLPSKFLSLAQTFLYRTTDSYNQLSIWFLHLNSKWIFQTMMSKTEFLIFPSKNVSSPFAISVNGNSILVVAQKFLLYPTLHPLPNSDGSKFKICSESGHFSPFNHSHPVKAIIMTHLNYGNGLLADLPDLIFIASSCSYHNSQRDPIKK